MTDQEILQLAGNLGTRIDYLWGAFFLATTGTVGLLIHDGLKEWHSVAKACITLITCVFLILNLFVLLSTYEYMGVLTKIFVELPEDKSIEILKKYVTKYASLADTKMIVAKALHFFVIIGLVIYWLISCRKSKRVTHQQGSL